MNILRVLMLCIAFSLIFIACSKTESEDKNVGVLVDNDVLSSIMKDMQDKEDSLLAEDGEVFWTPSGALWHATYECPYLANSNEIFHGTPDEAMLEGKERACSRCFATDIDKAYSELEGKPIEESDVFFTKDGEKWHSDINCPQILGAESIYNADIDKARELGKTGACDECNDK